MDFIDEIVKETIIICSSGSKDKIIGMNLLKPIKIMTIDEFIKNYYFSYEEDAITYVMHEYNVRYEVALGNIKNIYYVLNKSYGNKLDMLVDIKNRLIDKGLLKYNSYFLDYIRNKEIIIYDMDLDRFYFNMFEGLNYRVIDRKYHNYSHSVYEFKDINDEVYYVAYEIVKLIDKGIDIRHIKLTNVLSEYYNDIMRIFSLFGLKVNIKYNRKLGSYPLVREFISKYDGNLEILDTFDKNDFIYPELVKVINKYIKYNDKELLLYKINNSVIENKIYDNGIEIINYLDYIPNDNDYIFMLGFNEGVVPNYYMDTEYITDNIRDMVYLDKITDKNIKLKDRVLKIIHDIKNLTITYKLHDGHHTKYPSSLISEFDKVVTYPEQTISYSSVFDKMRLVKMYDEYLKYGYIDKDMGLLFNNYKIKYNSFDNKYSPVLINLEKVYLSYTKLNMYSKCSFRYYINYVLKIDPYQEHFSSFIGSMVHYVIENVLKNKDIDIDKYAKEYLGNRVLTRKEEYFFDKYKGHIKELLDEISLEKDYSSLDKEEYELPVNLHINDKLIFDGKIDKILYTVNDDKTYIAIVDYKTGDSNISFDYLKDGINIQIPIYMYLCSKLDYKNINYVGFYLQKFDIVNKDYRLVGYSNSDKDILSLIDSNYMNSKIIAGLKTKQDGGFYNYSKVISNEEIDKVIKDTEEVILRTSDMIMKNSFPINPKKVADEDIGCAYCKYHDICFRKNEDYVEISSEER